VEVLDTIPKEIVEQVQNLKIKNSALQGSVDSTATSKMKKFSPPISFQVRPFVTSL
jgi:hypothetical protein